MYNFIVQAYATYRGLFYWLNWISYTSNIIAGPAIFVITYALMGSFAFDIETARYYGLGIILNQMSFMLISGVTQAYTYDRSLGTICFFYASPASRLLNYLSRPVLHYPNGLIVFSVGLTALWLLVDIDFSLLNWSGFVLVVLVTAASIVAFSQFLGTFAIVVRDWINAMTVSVGILFVFTGMLVPVDALPAPIRWVSGILPITNGLAAIRASFEGSRLTDLYPFIAREAVIGGIYLIIGFFGFVFFERVARRTGTLETDSF